MVIFTIIWANFYNDVIKVFFFFFFWFKRLRIMFAWLILFYIDYKNLRIAMTQVEVFAKKGFCK